MTYTITSDKNVTSHKQTHKTDVMPGKDTILKLLIYVHT
jgi:hypothetical protein